MIDPDDPKVEGADRACLEMLPISSWASHHQVTQCHLIMDVLF